MSNVYLIGMMGSGKTVTGKILASLAGFDFVDLDEEIQKRTRNSISQIFEKQGEEYFRFKETAILKEVSLLKDCVIATGGGIVLRDDNVQLMQNTGSLIYLESSPETLWQRVKDKKTRPLLAGENPQNRLNEILTERKSKYESVSNHRIVTDGLSPETVAKKIIEELAK